MGQRATRRQRPIEAKESRKWLDSLAAVNEARHECPQTHWVSVGDREADVYDLFVMERAAGVDLLIRAAWDRRVAHEERYLWATVLAQPVAEMYTLHVPRRQDQPARTAMLTMRFGAVELLSASPSPGRAAPDRVRLGGACGGGVSARRGRAAGMAPAHHPAGPLAADGPGVRGMVHVPVWH